MSDHSDYEEESTYDQSEDPYQEYFWVLYDEMHQYIKQHYLLVLDQDKFEDFYEFCVEHMNQEAVNADLAIIEANYQMSTFGAKSSGTHEEDLSEVGEDGH